MSSRGWPTETLLSRLLPLTPWGALLTAVGAALFTCGVVRGELASLAWGSSFLALCLYSLAGSQLYGLLLRRHLRREPDPVDCTLPALGVFPAQEAEAHIRAEMPRAAVPGFRLQLLLALRFQGRPPLLLRCPLQRGSTSRTVHLPCPHRGSYASSRALIVVADRLGFTRGLCSLPLQETLRVYPALLPESALRPATREGGRRQRRSRPRPSQELLEVRRYFPGDDIRRLHWKVFAHTRELFLRVGEQSPPPTSRVLVLLDVCPSAAVPAGLAADHLDGLVEACAAGLRGLPPGAEVLFAASCESASRPVHGEAFAELLAHLASLWWDERLAFRPAAADRRMQVLLYSTPGSANLPRLVASLAGHDVLLLLKGLPESGATRLSRLARFARGRALFLRQPAGDRPRRASARGRQAFDEALQGSLERWRRRLRGKGHVQRI